MTQHQNDNITETIDSINELIQSTQVPSLQLTQLFTLLIGHLTEVNLPGHPLFVIKIVDKKIHLCQLKMLQLT